jgi:hypothetical protein
VQRIDNLKNSIQNALAKRGDVLMVVIPRANAGLRGETDERPRHYYPPTLSEEIDREVSYEKKYD